MAHYSASSYWKLIQVNLLLKRKYHIFRSIFLRLGYLFLIVPVPCKLNLLPSRCPRVILGGKYQEHFQNQLVLSCDRGWLGSSKAWCRDAQSLDCGHVQSSEPFRRKSTRFSLQAKVGHSISLAVSFFFSVQATIAQDCLPPFSPPNSNFAHIVNNRLSCLTRITQNKCTWNQLLPKPLTS